MHAKSTGHLWHTFLSAQGALCWLRFLGSYGSWVLTNHLVSLPVQTCQHKQLRVFTPLFAPRLCPGKLLVFPAWLRSLLVDTASFCHHDCCCAALGWCQDPASAAFPCGLKTSGSPGRTGASHHQVPSLVQTDKQPLLDYSGLSLSQPTKSLL